MLMWALVWSQKHGFPVLPCDPATKSPLIDGGKLSASRDPDQIRAWWTKFPDAMIGGRCDGLVVLDLDAYKPGHAEDLRSLEPLPPTRSFRTPGESVRGRHLVYLDPAGLCRSTKLGRNRTIDVRAGTSRDYIILPPSVGAHGRAYEVIDWRPPADAPAQLIEAAGRSPERTEILPDGLPPHEPLPRSLRVVAPADAGASEHTYLLARNALRSGLSPGQIRTLLEEDEVTRGRLAEARRQQPGWWPDEFWRIVRQAQDEVTEGAEDEKASAAQIIMRIGRRDFDFGRTTESAPWAAPKQGPRIAHIFRGGKSSFRASLAGRFEQELGRPPSQNALSEALQVFENVANNKPRADLPMRTAWHDGEIVLDLGSEDGKAVVIGPGGWKIVDQSPVLFLRTDLTDALPEPQRGGRLADTLLPLLNLGRSDQPLAVAAILSWLWPDIDHPVIYLRGEEGTAKTSLAKIIRSLVDPSIVEVRRQPGKDEDWEVTIAGQQIVILDNLSTLPDWLSDALCTAVTGTSSVKRRMYSDQDLSVIRVRRSFIITSIDTLISRGDLVDRTILFELEPLAQQRDRGEVESLWRAARPLALGALLDLAVKVLAAYSATPTPGKFRLADFSHIAAAMDAAAGTSSLDRYAHKVAEGIRSSVEQDPFAAHLIFLAGQDWEGSAQALFDTYKIRLGRVGSSDLWPKNPQAMGTRIRRISGVLRKSGISATQYRTNSSRGWRLHRTDA